MPAAAHCVAFTSVAVTTTVDDDADVDVVLVDVVSARHVTVRVDSVPQALHVDHDDTTPTYDTHGTVLQLWDDGGAEAASPQSVAGDVDTAPVTACTQRTVRTDTPPPHVALHADHCVPASQRYPEAHAAVLQAVLCTGWLKPAHLS